MADETNKNEFMGAFAGDVLAGRHSSIQGKIDKARFEILLMPENAPGITLTINTADPHIIAKVILELADAIRSESAK